MASLSGLRCLAFAIVGLVALSSSPNTIVAADRIRVDVALVLAIDTSGSIDARDLAMQLKGTAEALRNQGVAEAFTSGPLHTGAIAFVLFGDAEFTPYASGWTIVRSDADSITFATSILTDGRVIYGNTGIGSGIGAGLDLLDRAVFDAERKVIDVSGDGRETSVPLRRRINPSLAMARNRAKQSSVTINGLAILQEDRQLRDYFDKSVKIGADSFVMSVDYFEDITEAMTRKLIREIQPRGIVAEGASGDHVRRSSFFRGHKGSMSGGVFMSSSHDCNS